MITVERVDNGTAGAVLTIYIYFLKSLDSGVGCTNSELYALDLYHLRYVGLDIVCRTRVPAGNQYYYL